MKIRLATEKDLEAIAKIYDEIHTEEEAGCMTVGWCRGVYPTAATAREATEAGEMYVMEDEGMIVASGRINRQEMPAYAQVPWRFSAENGQVLVLHTLTVSPGQRGHGYGPAFVRFYEAMALEKDIHELRIDTNERNANARYLYAKLGWEERGIIPTNFNGIPGVGLVCL